MTAVPTSCSTLAMNMLNNQSDVQLFHDCNKFRRKVYRPNFAASCLQLGNTFAVSGLHSSPDASSGFEAPGSEATDASPQGFPCLPYAIVPRLLSLAGGLAVVSLSVGQAG